MISDIEMIILLKGKWSGGGNAKPAGLRQKLKKVRTLNS
jgi:hypothetical protein